ncbi:MAG TPA: S8 family serine peptidase [Streptosporangiaceae bacterium]|jgi:hypothetical protein
MLTARRGPGVRTAASALAIGAATASLMLAGAAPALADSVRDRQQWVLSALDVAPAWQHTQGQGVTVAVIDSGVVPGVSDLAGSVTAGPDLTGVGTPPTSPDWGLHGTWMASLVAGHGHDGSSGVLGTAPQARVLSIRVITDRADPGYAAYQHQPLSRGQRELSRAIRYAVRHHAGVISMSLGYGASSLVVRSALQDAASHGVVVVASSGNLGDAAAAKGNGHAPYSFPADYPGVLGVAAVNRAGAPARFSSENLSVEVAAPGVEVPAQGNNGQYWLVSGTSPACALTAGVAALIKSAYPALSPALVRKAITSSTSNRPSGGYDDEVGFGTVDAAAALSAAGHLARQHPQRSMLAGHRFGGGPAAIPPSPVGQRGSRTLVLLSLLAAVCLVGAAGAAWRMLAARRGPAIVPVPIGMIPFPPPGRSLPPAQSGHPDRTADWPAEPEPPHHEGGHHAVGQHEVGQHGGGEHGGGEHDGGQHDGGHRGELPRLPGLPKLRPAGRHAAVPDRGGAAEAGE